MRNGLGLLSAGQQSVCSRTEHLLPSQRPETPVPVLQRSSILARLLALVLVVHCWGCKSLPCLYVWDWAFRCGMYIFAKGWVTLFILLKSLALKRLPGVRKITCPTYAEVFMVSRVSSRRLVGKKRKARLCCLAPVKLCLSSPTVHYTTQPASQPECIKCRILQSQLLS